jgi:hypothetical protein
MTKRRVVSVGILALGAVAFACSGGDDGGGSGATSSGFVDEYCRIFSQCCAQGGYPSDGATCRNFYNQIATSRVYDAAKGEQCLSALRTAQSDATFCNKGPSAPECSGVYKSSGGASPPGGACDDDDDCASSSEGEVDCVTSFSNNATRRTCQVRVRAKEGEECGGTKDGNSTSGFGTSSTDGGAPPIKIGICHTEDGLYCDSTTRKCTRIQDVGGPCTSFTSYTCVKTAYCDSTQKICVARLAAGADCIPTTSTSQERCIDLHYCDEATRKCTLGLPVDAPCQRNQQCQSRSCTNGKCRTSGLNELGLVLLCGPKAS